MTTPDLRARVHKGIEWVYEEYEFRGIENPGIELEEFILDLIREEKRELIQRLKEKLVKPMSGVYRDLSMREIDYQLDEEQKRL